MPAPKPVRFLQKRSLKALIGVSLLLAALVVHPVSITITRLLIILCSGLVRKALVNTHARLGLTTLNPGQTRKALDLWWHDASAKFMRDGYENRLRSLGEAPNVNSLDLARLLPGDLAVTMTGVHVMAYSGDGTWIEAEPDAGRTIILRAPSDTHLWIKTPIRLLRWICFDQ